PSRPRPPPRGRCRHRRSRRCGGSRECAASLSRRSGRGFGFRSAILAAKRRNRPPEWTVRSARRCRRALRNAAYAGEATGPPGTKSSLRRGAPPVPDLPSASTSTSRSASSPERPPLLADHVGRVLGGDEPRPEHRPALEQGPGEHGHAARVTAPLGPSRYGRASGRAAPRSSTWTGRRSPPRGPTPRTGRRGPRCRRSPRPGSDRGPPLLGLDHPLEAHRVALGHVRPLDDDDVSVLEVLLEGGGATPTERCPQTGDGGGVSYAGLVLDLDG